MYYLGEGASSTLIEILKEANISQEVRPASLEEALVFRPLKEAVTSKVAQRDLTRDPEGTRRGLHSSVTQGRV